MIAYSELHDMGIMVDRSDIDSTVIVLIEPFGKCQQETLPVIIGVDGAPYIRHGDNLISVLDDFVLLE